MQPVQFGAKHQFDFWSSARPSETLEERHQYLRDTLRELALKNGFTITTTEYYPQNLNRPVNPEKFDYMTEIEIDTGRNRGRYKDGQLFIEDNEGDLMVAAAAKRLKARPGMEALDYSSAVDPDKIDLIA